MHAGILSWVLFGAWFAPPASMPIPAVNVAIVSPSEYLAMVMSDVPPEVTVEAKKIKESREIFENIPAFPKEELMVSRTSVLAQVADAGEPESQPSKPELKPFLIVSLYQVTAPHCRLPTEQSALPTPPSPLPLPLSLCLPPIGQWQ